MCVCTVCGLTLVAFCECKPIAHRQRPLSVVEREGAFACLWIFRSAVVTLGVVSWPLGHERHPFATRGQGLCFRFWHFPVHGEVAAPGVFDLVQGGVGLGEQFGVGLAVTREQADADACRDDIILPEGDTVSYTHLTLPTIA